jgi:hypothetical protein
MRPELHDHLLLHRVAVSLTSGLIDSADRLVCEVRVIDGSGNVVALFHGTACRMGDSTQPSRAPGVSAKAHARLREAIKDGKLRALEGI